MGKKPVTKFGKSEKPDTARTIIQWVLIVFGIGAIALMIYKNPKLKKLHCEQAAYPAFNSFGSCTEE